jgi:hypothetical protein
MMCRSVCLLSLLLIWALHFVCLILI